MYGDTCNGWPDLARLVVQLCDHHVREAQSYCMQCQRLHDCHMCKLILAGTVPSACTIKALLDYQVYCPSRIKMNAPAQFSLNALASTELFTARFSLIWRARLRSWDVVHLLWKNQSRSDAKNSWSGWFLEAATARATAASTRMHVSVGITMHLQKLECFDFIQLDPIHSPKHEHDA